MEKALGYILGDLHMLKHDMKVTANNFKKQKAINGMVIFMFAGIIMYIDGLNKCRIEQSEKLESLKKEIEELKETKGE